MLPLLLCALASLFVQLCAADSISQTYYNVTVGGVASTELPKQTQYVQLLGAVDLELPPLSNLTVMLEVSAHNEVIWSMPHSYENECNYNVSVTSYVEMYPCEFEALHEEGQTTFLLTATVQLLSPPTYMQITVTLTLAQVADITDGSTFPVTSGTSVGIIQVAGNATDNSTAAYAIALALTSTSSMKGHTMLLGTAAYCPLRYPVKSWDITADDLDWNETYSDAGVGTWYFYVLANFIGTEHGTCTVAQSYTPAVCDATTLVCHPSSPSGSSPEESSNSLAGSKRFWFPMVLIGVGLVIVLVVAAIVAGVAYYVHKRRRQQGGEYRVLGTA
eukprot:TRINITY_DN3693_c1_g1_i1.p1 TRINITY_DN3693_c1_g1~~TRINITY_DN3693_c1_g1_i1.p1  ORF type:complete len:339 (+),score=67.68 TRINITY_DN3693_c1_g1_i1:23-1018(+)